MVENICSFFTNIFKKSPRLLIHALGVFLMIALFLPNGICKQMQVYDLREKYISYLFSSLIFIISIEIVFASEWLHDKCTLLFHRLTKNWRMESQLGELNRYEYELLLKIYNQPNCTMGLDITSPIVDALRRKGVITISTKNIISAGVYGRTQVHCTLADSVIKALEKLNK